MEYQQIREYQIRQRAKNVAETPWLILPGENKLTRRAIKLSFIKDHKDPQQFIGVHVEVLFQNRKNQAEPWPSQTINLAQVPRNFGFKFSLDSALSRIRLSDRKVERLADLSGHPQVLGTTGGVDRHRPRRFSFAYS